MYGSALSELFTSARVAKHAIPYDYGYAEPGKCDAVCPRPIHRWAARPTVGERERDRSRQVDNAKKSSGGRPRWFVAAAEARFMPSMNKLIGADRRQVCATENGPCRLLDRFNNSPAGEITAVANNAEKLNNALLTIWLNFRFRENSFLWAFSYAEGIANILTILACTVIVIFSSFQEWANAMARRSSSVRPSVNFCANPFFSQANGRIATKLAQDGLQVSMQGVLKVKVKVKGHVIRALFWILGMSYSVIDGLVYFVLYRLSRHRAFLHALQKNLPPRLTCVFDILNFAAIWLCQLL